MEDVLDVEESKESLLESVVSDVPSNRRNRRNGVNQILPELGPASKMKKVKFWGELMTPLSIGFLDLFDGGSTLVKYKAGCLIESPVRV